MSSSKAVRRRIYTPNEVSTHNVQEDCWVSVHYKVFDLTALLEGKHGTLARPILEHAGRDLSEWFDLNGDKVEVKHHLDPVTGLWLPFVPMGRFVHVPPSDPVSTWRNDFGLPWWQDLDKYCIGSLSRKTRRIRIVNTLTTQDDVLEVGSEETVDEIQQRYETYNKHAASYVWKALDDEGFRPLDMEKTLEENGVADEAEEFERLGISHDEFIPVVHLYFKDDLTEA